MTPEDCELVLALVTALQQISEQLGAKNASIARLRALLFGAKTEKTRKVLNRGKGGSTPGKPDAASSDDGGQPLPATPGKRKGHGRNSEEMFTGAERIPVPHEELFRGCECPTCGRGKLQDIPEPARTIRIVGRPCLAATIWEAQRLRCGACGEMFTAPLPPEAKGPKYDATAGSMLSVLRYGNGFANTRLEQHQKDLGVPVPASVQYEVASEVAETAGPVFEELIRQAAQREVIHNDDTTARILSHKKEPVISGKKAARKGVFTTSIVARGGGPDITLFFTGRKHAGENLLDVLKQRLPSLGPPIQVCDALNRNYPKDFLTLVANCLAHGRRKFVAVANCFPAECQRVLDDLAVIYRNDAEARKQNLSAEARLAYHQEHSAPTMHALHQWLRSLIDERKVESNSTLGKAIEYMMMHWKKLTLFLQVAGAPLDNNVCERALKMSILHRKNSLFYKTDAGAAVGDLLMSLIYSCRGSGANPFDYLTELQRQAAAMRKEPSAWLPWNYKQALAQLPAV